ncbi:hypothetical protein [Absidia glauca]|uniref:Uncharacterized protein n=1 Tax=Absidia glauca TaxID=4829 RepID=A0A168NLP3_ABSGL|nr:hypothetical protein [Absidia glauca]
MFIKSTCRLALVSSRRVPKMMLYSTTTTTTVAAPPTQDNQTMDQHHDHFHALYNNENQSVLADLDHPLNDQVSASTFAPTFNSVFDE